MIRGKRRDAADHIGQSIAIHRRHAAEPIQQPRAFEFRQQRQRFVMRHRRRRQRGVLQQLDQDAAEPDHHQRSEQRIDARADHHLDALRHHLLHQHAGDPRRRRHRIGPRHDRLIRLAHLVGVAQVEPHDASLGLVRQVGRFDLQHHRIAERSRGIHRFVHALRDALADHRHAVQRQHLLRLALGQRAAAGGSDQRACLPHGLRRRCRDRRRCRPRASPPANAMPPVPRSTTASSGTARHAPPLPPPSRRGLPAIRSARRCRRSCRASPRANHRPGCASPMARSHRSAAPPARHTPDRRAAHRRRH